MEITESGVCPLNEWQRLSESSDDVWLFHLPAWVNLTAEVYSLENHYFCAKENGDIIGGIPFQAYKNGRWPLDLPVGYSIFMGSCGPFCPRDLPLKKKIQIFGELTDEIVKWSKANGIYKISCYLPSLSSSSIKNRNGINPLVLSGWTDTSTHTRIIDLAKPEDELLKDLAKDARQQIKKAQSQGYYVKKVNWKSMLDEYYRLHKETYRRTGANPHPYEYFKAIATIAEEGHAQLWACFDRSDKPVAFHNDGRFNHRAQYWTGCSETAHSESGVNYLLFWEAISGSKRDGCEYYDIGEVFPNVRQGKLNGLSVFKSKFGGDIYRYYKGEIVVNPAGVTRKMISAYKCLKG